MIGQLTKRKRGKPRKYDFSDLKHGETVKLIGRKVRKNPNAYIWYWNYQNPNKKVEILVDEAGTPYVRLVTKPL